MLLAIQRRDEGDPGVMLYGQGNLAQQALDQRRARSREIVLVIDKPNGDRADIRLIRSVDWIETHNAKVGGEIFLDLPHIGARGFARVVAIESCPPLGQGAGRLVTGTFRHTSGEVYDVKLASETKPIGVTATHPFWSVDRNAWVSAIDLEIGEKLKTLSGTTVVERRTKREEPETVYNIEVEGDHVFRVGESGVLVHNASAPCCSGLSNTGASSPVENVSVGGRTVPIYGKGQRTGSATCPGGVNKHRQASERIARDAAATGDYEYLTVNRAWSTSTGGATADTRRPDVIGVRCDGKVVAWEVISGGDDPADLDVRVRTGYATLPATNKGTPPLVRVVPPAC